MKKVCFVAAIGLLCAFTWSENARDLLPITPVPQDSLVEEIYPIEVREVTIPVEDVFAPKGYDSNDNAIIYVSGRLPSPCYRRPKALVVRNGQNFSVVMNSTVVKSRNRVCIAMTIPFLAEVELGKLSEGNYSLSTDGRHHSVRTAQWQVEKPNRSSIDNYIYAQVKNVRVSNGRNVFIEGENASDCIQLDRIESVFNGKNTYAILPIMKQVKTNCPEMPSKFIYGFRLPNDSDSKQVLIHVRSVDGTAVNHLIERD